MGEAACSQCGTLEPAEGGLLQYDSKLICAQCKARFFQQLREGGVEDPRLPTSAEYVRRSISGALYALASVVPISLGAQLLMLFLGDSSRVKVFAFIFMHFITGIFYYEFLLWRYKPPAGMIIKIVAPPLSAVAVLSGLLISTLVALRFLSHGKDYESLGVTLILVAFPTSISFSALIWMLIKLGVGHLITRSQMHRGE